MQWRGNRSIPQLDPASQPPFGGRGSACPVPPSPDLGASQECEAVPKFQTDGLLWLEPAEFTAWRMRVKAEHLARNLTPARRDALVALQAMICTGDTEPTDEAVAALAGCSSRTVRRARADAHDLGLLSWQRTRRFVGGAWRQGPNTYKPVIPTNPITPCPPRPPRAQVDRLSAQARKISKEGALNGGPIVIPPNAKEALAAIAARRAVQLGLR